MRNIKKWKTEVKKYNLELYKKLEINSNKKKLYYGFEVIDGKIIQQPKILFIGINPGKGDGVKEKNIFETDRISYLDFFDEDYRYHLAEKTINFFKLIGWDEEKIKSIFEKEVVKTNFYHLATKSLSDLNTILNDINYKKEYFKKSAEFSIQLINLLKPKVLILEGKSVFDNIVEQCYGEKVWNSNNYGYLFDKQNNTHIIGYSRGRNFTNIDRTHFTNKLKEICIDSQI